MLVTLQIGEMGMQRCARTSRVILTLSFIIPPLPPPIDHVDE
jgi:hypothetical protein